MNGTLPEAMDRLLWAYRVGRPLVLLFDYNGTLAPIVEHPRLATLPPQTRALLERLARQPGLFLGFLSGRRLDNLKELVGLSDVYYAGTGGLELDLRGVRIIPPQAEKGRDRIDDLSRRLQEVLAAYPGSWVEHKQFGLTVHYRAVAPGAIEDLRARAAQVLQPWANELRILDGPMAIEVTLALGWTKGAAVRRIAEHVGQGAFPLYAGDEANDGDALEAAATLGGIALGIGARAPSTAQYRLPDPATLVNFLSGFLGLLDCGGHHTVSSRSGPGTSPSARPARPHCPAAAGPARSARGCP